MKRKIALLLAGVMAMSTLPMNIFASSTSGISSDVKLTGGSTLMASNTDGKYTQSASSYSTTNASGTAMNMVYMPGADAPVAVSSSGYYAYNADMQPVKVSKKGWYDTTDNMDFVADSIVEPAVLTIKPESVLKVGKDFSVTLGNAKFDWEKAGYANIDDANLALTGLINEASVLDDATPLTAQYSPVKSNQIVLTPELDDILPTLAGTSTAAGAVGANTVINIPLEGMYTTSTDNVTVAVEGSSLTAWKGTLATQATGATTTTVEGADTSKTMTKFDIITTENRYGTFNTVETVEYTVTSGYQFMSVGDVELVKGGAATPIMVESIGLGANVSATASLNSTGKVLTVNYMGISPSTSGDSAGLRVDDVVVKPDSSNKKYGTDITMSVKGKNNVTSQTNVVIGRYIDWSASATVVEKEIPTLITGQLAFTPYGADKVISPGTTKGNSIQSSDSKIFMEDAQADEGYSVADQQYDYFDEAHQTATIHFKEEVPNSWWSERSTVFTFDSNVKVIGMEISNIDGIDETTETASGAFAGEYFYNDTITSPYVDFDQNTVTLHDVTKVAGDSASFDVQFYVAANSSFDGDIDVTVGGSAVVDELYPVTVATAVAPYEIETKVTNVEIGFQSYDVADIYVSETELGRFSNDEKIYISLTTDDTAATSTNDILIRDAKVSVTEGDLELTSSIGTDKVTLTVDQESSEEEPSTIVISDVKVSINRNVPETNDEPFGIKIVTDDKNMDQGNTPSSIRLGAYTAPYINVITAGSGTNNQTVVELRIGSTECLVDGEVVEMGVAPFIDPATDSAMVPVRFISDAFGYRTDWFDGNPTGQQSVVTVYMDNNTTVQFPVGSNYYLDAYGKKIPNANGAVTQIKDERTFVPFRTVGIAFGIDDSNITYDESTQTCYYNAK